MGINKVMYGSKTVIDLSGSTVAPDKMLKGNIYTHVLPDTKKLAIKKLENKIDV